MIDAVAPRYDPYDVAINADPYPHWKRLRDEAPLYYDEQHDFYALSRHEDVERALVNWGSFSSARSSILELIQANIEFPAGIVLFEDPPIHDLHRGLLSRVFTPRRMTAPEPQIRALCAEALDPLVGTGELDFITHLGSEMFTEYIEWRATHPSDDLMTSLLTAEFEDETGTPRRSLRHPGPRALRPHSPRGQSDAPPHGLGQPG